MFKSRLALRVCPDGAGLGGGLGGGPSGVFSSASARCEVDKESVALVVEGAIINEVVLGGSSSYSGLLIL